LNYGPKTKRKKARNSRRKPWYCAAAHCRATLRGLKALVAAQLLTAWPALAQVPVSATLSETDSAQFHAEITRIEKLRDLAPDKSAVAYQMARTWASAKQWPETLTWLRSLAAAKAGLDPSRDPVFQDIHSTREFAEIMDDVRAATPPVSRS